MPPGRPTERRARAAYAAALARIGLIDEATRSFSDETELQRGGASYPRAGYMQSRTPSSLQSPYLLTCCYGNHSLSFHLTQRQLL